MNETERRLWSFEKVTNKKGHSRGELPCKGPKQSGVELMAATLDWWSRKTR